MLKSVVGTFGRQVIALLLNVLTISQVSRLLGAEGFGVFSLAVSIVVIGATCAYLSAPSVVIHYSSKLDLAEKGFLYGNGALIFLLGSIAVPLILYALIKSRLLPNSLDGAGLVVIAGSIVVQGGNAFCESVLLSNRRYKAFNALQLVAPSSFALFVFVGAPKSWVGCLDVYFLSYLIAFIFYFWFAWGYYKSVRLGAGRNLVSTYLGYGVKMWLANLVTVALYRMPLFIVEALVGGRGVGVYSVSSQFSEKLWMPGRAFAAILFPERSASTEIWSGKKYREGLFAVAVNMAIVFLGVLALYMAFLNFSEVLFGREFDGLLDTTLALGPGVVAWAGVTVLGAELAARGMSGANLMSSAWALVAFVLSVWTTQASATLVGIAACVSAAYIVGLSFSLYFYVNSYRAHLREGLL